MLFHYDRFVKIDVFMEEYYFSFNNGSTKSSKVRSQSSPLVLQNRVWSRKVAYKLIRSWRKKIMYQILILNWTTTKFILFTTKITIFRTHFKWKYAKTNIKTFVMQCYMTFVTKNKFLLIYFRRFLLFCLFLSFCLSFSDLFLYSFSPSPVAILHP